MHTEPLSVVDEFRGINETMQAVLLSGRTESGAAIGGKAAHVLWLLQKGFKVPETWVIPAGEPLASTITVASWLPDIGPSAVRSSADVVDGFESSYAGQFAAVLDVS